MRISTLLSAVLLLSAVGVCTTMPAFAQDTTASLQEKLDQAVKGDDYKAWLAAKGIAVDSPQNNDTEHMLFTAAKNGTAVKPNTPTVQNVPNNSLQEKLDQAVKGDDYKAWLAAKGIAVDSPQNNDTEHMLFTAAKNGTAVKPTSTEVTAPIGSVKTKPSKPNRPQKNRTNQNRRTITVKSNGMTIMFKF
jgi:Na+-translocating ferredoxin:NAD+ oxidoreductase RnfG subunit